MFGTVTASFVRCGVISYLDIMKYGLKYLLFCDSKMWIIIFRVRTHVDYSIHIQVQVIKLRYLKKKNFLILNKCFQKNFWYSSKYFCRCENEMKTRQ